MSINTLSDASAFLEALRRHSVWSKGRIIGGYDPNVWRADVYGNIIKFSAYGDRTSEYGWEIDHRTPSVLGGTGDLGNLRPLHWRENASRGGTLAALLGKIRRTSPPVTWSGRT